ncbi:killer cell lectin-like receptor subfamily F member 2 [Eubalaena glacialis]|uniref:killer cell lectin-like receptor subfamily F member 2 n=1 Tax=Eubalaena glacialis TaxID=27606 RepID=UPI002A5ABFD3|nr:killer cell lectin-like receptor subfamily F member 2 [Eubalaena glacialis]
MGNNYVCPNDSLLNQGKCYRFSASSKTWNESQHDCAKLQAYLPVTQNSKELEFIQKSLKSGQPSWIGLYRTSPGKQWMWINEHFVEQKKKKEKYSSLGEKRMDIRTNLEIGYPGLADTLCLLSPGFSMTGPVDNMSCAVITRNQVYFEDCDSKFNGICQRDVV